MFGNFWCNNIYLYIQYKVHQRPWTLFIFRKPPDLTHYQSPYLTYCTENFTTTTPINLNELYFAMNQAKDSYKVSKDQTSVKKYGSLIDQGVDDDLIGSDTCRT